MAYDAVGNQITSYGYDSLNREVEERHRAGRDAGPRRDGGNGDRQERGRGTGERRVRGQSGRGRGPVIITVWDNVPDELAAKGLRPANEARIACTR